jgi:hypothetical protein
MEGCDFIALSGNAGLERVQALVPPPRIADTSEMCPAQRLALSGNTELDRPQALTHYLEELPVPLRRIVIEHFALSGDTGLDQLQALRNYLRKPQLPLRCPAIGREVYV